MTKHVKTLVKIFLVCWCVWFVGQIAYIAYIANSSNGFLQYSNILNLFPSLLTPLQLLIFVRIIELLEKIVKRNEEEI